jgi:hypothetical protein
MMVWILLGFRVYNIMGKNKKKRKKGNKKMKGNKKDNAYMNYKKIMRDQMVNDGFFDGRFKERSVPNKKKKAYDKKGQRKWDWRKEVDC